MPKLITTPTAESLPPLNPKRASAIAAAMEPATAPRETLNPMSRAAAAPMSESSEVACTAKDICRITISGASTPESTPSSAQATREVSTKSCESRYTVVSHIR